MKLHRNVFWQGKDLNWSFAESLLLKGFMGVIAEWPTFNVVCRKEYQFLPWLSCTLPSVGITVHYLWFQLNALSTDYAFVLLRGMQLVNFIQHAELQGFIVHEPEHSNAAKCRWPHPSIQSYYSARVLTKTICWLRQVNMKASQIKKGEI